MPTNSLDFNKQQLLWISTLRLSNLWIRVFKSSLRFIFMINLGVLVWFRIHHPCHLLPFVSWPSSWCDLGFRSTSWCSFGRRSSRPRSVGLRSVLSWGSSLCTRSPSGWSWQLGPERNQDQSPCAERSALREFSKTILSQVHPFLCFMKYDRGACTQTFVRWSTDSRNLSSSFEVWSLKFAIWRGYVHSTDQLDHG